MKTNWDKTDHNNKTSISNYYGDCCMDQKSFEEQVRQVFPKYANIKFPSPGEYRGNYSSASILEDGRIEVFLDDFGGCYGYGRTVEEAYREADDRRHDLHAKQVEEV